MSDTSLRFNFLEGRNTANPAMRKAATEATAMATAMRVASAVAAAGMVTLGAAVVSAGAHLVALGQSAIVAAGAVTLIPAAIAAAVGTAIAGKIAFHGLGDAWKATGQAAISGGGASADIAHRVELANRGVRDATQSLADAQREALQAQDAVTRARETAAERLEDLSRSLRGARLDERGAVLALQEARQRLSQARGSRDVADVKRAQIAYEEAGLALESVRDRVSDLGKEQTEASQKGVEGSDEVVGAIQRQEQAQRQLVAATERLADAQRELSQSGKSGGGGADKAAQVLAALAPSAAALVTTLRALGPAWSAASKGAQQETWTGVAGDFQLLSGIYLPSITGWLTKMGQGFNSAIRETLGLAQTAEFASDVNTTLDKIATTSAFLGAAIRPFINGFMQFVLVGSTQLPGLAASVTTMAVQFEAWATAARNTGQMQAWMTTGVATLKQFWAVARDVVMTVVAIFKAGENAGTLDALVQGAAAMRAWAESAQGQAQIAGFLTFLRDIFSNLIQIVPVFMNNAGSLSDTMSVFGVVVGFLANNLDTFAAVLPTLITLFIAYKTVQMSVNILTLNGTILKIAEVVANWRHTLALNANSAALRANTVASATGDAVQKRSLVTMTAMKIATMAQAAANWILAPSTWAVLGPILLIILAIAALIVVIVLIIKYHREIGDFFVFVWGKIWDFLKMIGSWFAGPFAGFFVDTWDRIVALFNGGVAWVTGWVNRFLAPIMAIKDHIAKVGIWQTLVDGFKAAINALIGLWNRLDFAIGPFHIPSWVPFGLGGQTFSIPDIFPDIPRLDVGGHVTQSGLAVIHQGETVVPAAQTTAFRGGTPPRGKLTIGSDGSQMGRLLLEMIRTAVRDAGGDFDIVFER